jgi:two-component system chemotaxis response regulator CheY
MDKLSINELSLLVIEPSSSQSKIIKERLNSLDVNKVEFVSSGEEALSYMLKNLPDLVISAMYLPDTTADKLVTAMRNASRLRDIPFMLISSETSFKMLDPLRQAGIIAILPKPFEIQDLKKALSSTIDYITVDDDALADIEADIDTLSVLVVDDSITALRHITRVLGNLGIEKITTANNGLEAAKLINDNYYDLVITDYNMPEMDGEQLTRYIRENSSQRSIPILMVTSEERGSRLAAVQQAGVSGICDKPFDPQTVKELIKSALADYGN